MPICRRLEMHAVRLARFLALPSAGRSMAARMAMMAMTTSSSIRVKPLLSAFPFDMGQDYIIERGTRESLEV